MSTDQLDKLRPGEIGGLAVKAVKDVPVTFNALIYGEAGVGKTVLAGSAAAVDDMQPVLFIDMEGGTLSIRERFPSIDVVRVKTMPELQNVYGALFKKEVDYQTVVVDSLTELQKFSMNSVMRKAVEEDPDRDPDMPQLQEWGKNLEQTRRFVRAFRDLPINTIFTALANEKRDQKTGKTTIRPGLTGKAAAEVAGFLDIVAYMYIKEVDEELVRMLLTSQTDKVTGKDRTDKLPQLMANPTMQEIYELAFIANDEPDEEGSVTN